MSLAASMLVTTCTVFITNHVAADIFNCCLQLVVRLSACMDFIGEMFISNIFTIQFIHLCLGLLLYRPSAILTDAAAYLLHIVEPQVEQYQHIHTLKPAGVLDRMRLGVYYHRIEYFSNVLQMDDKLYIWIMVGRL